MIIPLAHRADQTQEYYFSVKLAEVRRLIASGHDVINIGTGRGETVLNIIETFERETGVAVNYTVGPRRPGDIEQVYADVTKANDVLGWSAGRSLAESLRDAWRWQQKL